jgi:hypothetical protein
MTSSLTSGGMRYVAQRLGLLLVFALVLFGSAGRLDWPRRASSCPRCCSKAEA